MHEKKPLKATDRPTRQRPRRTLSLCAALAASALVLGGCGGSSPSSSGSGSTGASSSTPISGGSLVIDRSNDAITLDPAQVSASDNVYTVNQIYDTLFESSADGHSVIPWLAKTYSLSDAGKTLTVNLRPGVTFSNGQPLTAADVKFSLDRVLSMKSSAFGYLLDAIATVDAPSKLTAVIHLHHAWAPILADLSAWVAAILPNKLDGETAKTFFQHPIGTGPFKLGSWVPGSHITLIRNPRYWQAGKPYLDSLTWEVVPDANTRVAQVESGQSQVAEEVPLSEVSSLRQASGTTAEAFPADWTEVLIFNEHAKPFQDMHVRRAIAYATDGSALASGVLFGAGSAGCSLIPPTMAYYDAATPCLTYNLAKARAEMQKSSTPQGFSTVLTVGDIPTDISTAQAVEAMLLKLNIKATIKIVPESQEYNLYGKGQYDFGVAGWASDIPDPDEQVSYMLDPAAGGNSYYTYYSNPHLSALIESAEATVNTVRRAALYRQIQAIQSTDVPQTVLYYQDNAYAWSTKVHGFSVDPLGQQHYENVWLSR